VEEVSAAGCEIDTAPVDRGAEPAPDTIARDGGAGAPADRERHSRRRGGAVAAGAQGDATHALAGCPSQGLERRTVANAPDQAESLFRPRVRRDRRTARPPRVRLRGRKPWVFFRLRVFGW